VAFGICLLASGARAQDATVALEYAAVAQCPGPDEFKDVVTGRLGYDAFRDDGTDRVSVHIAPRGRSFEGRIEWRDKDGKWAGDRTFPSRSEDCGELARAVAFALALQIQLSAKAHPSAEIPAAPVESPPSPAPVVAPLPPVVPPVRQPEVTKPNQPAPSPRPRPVLSVGVGGLVGWGMGPEVPGVRGFTNLAWPNWSVQLGAEIGWPATIRREDGAGFSHQELLLAGAGCAIWQPWSACLLGKAGQVRISGKGVDAPASPSGVAVETGLGLTLLQPLGTRLFLAAHVEGLVVLTKWQVTLDRMLLWTSPRLVGSAGLDMGVRFP
jgi:hypothetical protein